MSADKIVADERLLFRRPAEEEPEAVGAERPPEAGIRSPLPPARGYYRKISGFRSRIQSALATETDFATPFLFVPVLLGAGAVMYFTASSEPDWTALCAGLAVVGLSAFAARMKPLAGTLILSALLLLAGVLAGKLENWRSSTKMLGSAVTTNLSGRVVALERQPGGRTRVIIDVHSTDRPRLRYAPDRVRIVARKLPANVAPGMHLSGRARLIPHSGPVRPHGYDFAYHAYFDGLGAVGFFLGTPRIDAGTDIPWNAMPAIWLEQARDSLSGRIRRRIGGSEGELAAALITGAKAGIPEEINEALRRTGLAHILSISGLHMALVAGTVITVMRLGFAMFPGFASRWPVRKFAAFAALCTVTLYLFVSGAGIATQRSFLMLSVMLVALMLDRPAITMRNLAIAAIVIILLRPHEVIGPGFQMSFAATAALLAVYSGWSARGIDHAASGKRATAAVRPPVIHLVRKLALYAGALMVTSLVAGVATAIFGVWHFHRLAPLGLFANLAAMPVVSVVVMPSAVAAMALMPFNLDGPAFAMMGLGIRLVVLIASWFSERTPVDTVGMIPAASLLAASAGLVLATLPRTPLRLLCLPVFSAALVLALMRPLPDLLISEDGKLVAIRRADGVVAVDSTRPRAFTMGIWKRATAADDQQGPKKSDNAIQDMSTASAPVERFVCDERTCLARLANGALIAHVKSAEEAAKLCGMAALIVIRSATGPPDPCAYHRLVGGTAGAPVVVTARQLARSGAMSAEIHIENNIAEPPFSARRYSVSRTHALAVPWRPWHAYRAFSREARGLPPIERRPRKKDAQPGRISSDE